METNTFTNDFVLVSLERLRQELGAVFEEKIASYLERVQKRESCSSAEEHPDNVFLDVRQVCEMLRISRVTLWRIEANGDIKPSRVFGKKKLYLKSDVIKAGKGL